MSIVKFAPPNKEIEDIAIGLWQEIDALVERAYSKGKRGSNERAAGVAVILMKYAAHWMNNVVELDDDNIADHKFKLQFGQVKPLATDLFAEFMDADHAEAKEELQVFAREFARHWNKSKLRTAIVNKERSNKQALAKLRVIMTDAMGTFEKH